MEKNLKKWLCHDPYWTMSQIEKLRKEGVPEKDVAVQLGFESTIAMRRWRSGFSGGSKVVYRAMGAIFGKGGKDSKRDRSDHRQRRECY